VPLFGGRRGEQRVRAGRGMSHGMFPSDMAQWLEAYGRFEWDPQRSPMYELRLGDFYAMAQADPDAFLRELAALTVPAGSWVALGGKYLVLDLMPNETDTPDFNAIVLAGFQFLRQSSVPPNRLSERDHELWSRVKTGDEPWLVWSEPPKVLPTPLRPGEVRKVAQILRADGLINDILVRQETDKVTAVIEGAYSETATRRTQTEWHSAPSLRELYIRIGDTLQIPPHWMIPELEPYIPLPPMTI
jgi:hypothetical protein